MKALILSAFGGENLYPFTSSRPKVLLPIANTNFLESAIGKIKDIGIKEVVVVIGRFGEQIVDHFGTGERMGLTIQYVRQDEPTGIRDAILMTKSLFQDEFFMLVYPDSCSSGNVFENVFGIFSSSGKPVAAITHTNRAEDFGTVFLNTDLSIRRVVEKPSKKEIANYVLSGAFILPKSFFELLSEMEIDESLNSLVADSGLASAIWEQGWLDPQWPWELLNVNKMLMDAWNVANVDTSVQLRGSIQFRGPVVIESNVIIEDGTSIFGPCFIGKDSYVGNGVLIRPYTSIGPSSVIGFGVELKNCILMGNSRVGRLSFIGDSVVGEKTEFGSGTMTLNQAEDEFVKVLMPSGLEDTGLEKLGSLIGDGCKIGASNTFAPGSILPAESSVSPFITFPSGDK
ncbi:MAG: sugar phosphate nucleotidyltransferase [Nitrospinota bacterium]|nr:sugar phosphate nucleotidyltransferase [Nitrospinota bacterium]